jgi:asparagine synthase (glutamine-hydrolysing)
MCGIAGVVTWNDRFRITREMLGGMSARIAHRGPDAEGIWLNHDGQITPDHPQVGLVHRRLSILDPDPRANQPFTDQRGRQLVFNGEIYNFLDLRRELQQLQPHYTWRTRCDTEVLLVAYDVWGEKCVEHFNGMFAFAIWDSVANELFCAIDRMGQKPLYWAAMDGAVAFASELPALRQISWVSKEIDDGALLEYLRWGYISALDTIYQNVFKFAPATTRAISPSGARSTVYFDPNKVAKLRAAGNVAKLTEDFVRRAVKRQLVSDVPVGCFLSGGMDSSIIAAAMQASLRDQRAMTFSIGFDDPRYDETEYAAAVAKHLGTDHHQFIVRPNAIADLPALAAVFGEPFGDSSALPTHYLARETRQFVKVALSGDGGDELFGGYDRYRAVRISYALDFVPFGRQILAFGMWKHLSGSHPKSNVARFKRFANFARDPDVMEAYRRCMMLFPSALRTLLPSDWLYTFLAQNRPNANLPPQLLAPSRKNPVEAALALDRISYLPGDLLTKVDRCSMFHALEVRSPFMDHELVHFAAGLTSAQLLQGGPKRMLREAFAADLPAWVFSRKKMGFAVPIGEWFRGPLRDMLRDSLFAADSFAASHFRKSTLEKLVDEHEMQTADHSQRLYALLMLELWWRWSL